MLVVAVEDVQGSKDVDQALVVNTTIPTPSERLQVYAQVSGLGIYLKGTTKHTMIFPTLCRCHRAHSVQ